MKVTPEGDALFSDLIRKEDWKGVLSASPDNHRMAVEFHAVLEAALNRCYSWKKVRRKTNDKPWMTDGLRTKMKQWKAVFRMEGRSEKWKRLDKSISKTIYFRKATYNKTQKKRLEETGRTGQWYNICLLYTSPSPRD